MHRVRKKRLQRAPLTSRLTLQPRQELRERLALLALRQHLQRVVMVPDILLVYRQHGQEHVEQVPCGHAYSLIVWLTVHQSSELRRHRMPCELWVLRLPVVGCRVHGATFWATVTDFRVAVFRYLEVLVLG